MAAEDYIDFDVDPSEGDDWPFGNVPRRIPYLKPTADAPRRGSTWSKTEDGQLRSMYRNCYTMAQMAKELGRTELAIEYRLKHHGLEEPTASGYTRQAVMSRGLTLQAAVHTANALTPKENLMHQDFQHLLALLQKGYTTITVAFFRDGSNSGSFDTKTYTYKVPEAIAKTLAPGDLVVVPARNIFAVAQVSEIHETPQIDVDRPLELKWIVQKVDRTAYDDQTTREAEAVQTLTVAKRRQAQEAALQTLLGSTEDREAFLKLINPAA